MTLRERLSNWQAKQFLKMIDSPDLPIAHADAQMVWAKLCARAAWKAFTTDKTVFPIVLHDHIMNKALEGEWIDFNSPANQMRLTIDDECDAFMINLNTVEPKELIADPDVQKVLSRSYDLLEVVEENAWELPPDVTSKAHKLRSAIQKQVGKAISDGTSD